MMDGEKHKMRPHPNLHMHIGNSQMGKNWGEKEKDIVLLFIDMVWHYLLDPSKGLFGSSINVKNKGKEMSNCG